MNWTRYAAWSRLLFFPGFALFLACTAAPMQRGLLSWLRCLGLSVGLIILLSGLPVIIRQLSRFEPSVWLAPSVASLGCQGLTTGAAGVFLVLIGLITALSGVETKSFTPWVEVVAGGILLMLAGMTTAVWRARRSRGSASGEPGRIPSP